MRTTTYAQHSYTVHEHHLGVPLDHSRPISPTNSKVRVFARETIRPGGEKLPHLVSLQGGPGGKGPRQGDSRDGWVGEALEEFRVMLLDQRGTGQSTCMDWQALQELPDDQARVDHLMLSRQDQVIKDAEAFCTGITDGAKWMTPGQSYGGFLTLIYLSITSGAVETSLVIGGFPGLVHADDIYRLNCKKITTCSRLYFSRYSGDEQKIREVAAHVRGTGRLLLTGERLSSKCLRMIGMSLRTQSRTDMSHYLLEGPFVTLRGERRLSLEFPEGVAAEVAMSPMYDVLQETIYVCAVPELVGTAAAWSADRLAEEVSGFARDADPLNASELYYLTGKHMMRRIFDKDPALAPLMGTSDIFATRTGWPTVYSPKRFAADEVPIAAIVYEEDMFIPCEFSLAIAQAVCNTRTQIVNKYQHNGLRASSGRVFAHFLELLRD